VSGERWFVVGGAGFIGGHFVDALLARDDLGAVTIYDNFSSGREWHYAAHVADPRFTVVRGDVHDEATLHDAMADHDVVIHLASNPDIAAAMTDPDIDFREGTLITRDVVEAMRHTGTTEILYASGSGVYGDLGLHEAAEDHGPLVPTSTYGASKLAGEALISSYAAMFDLRGRVFRFGNVVGPRQTHGVGFDFVRRLRADPTRLTVLGDGSQSKSYVHVHDVVRAVLLAHERTTGPFAAYNVATGDYITVSEIAQLAIECLGIDPDTVALQFGTEPRGWKGDVPIVRLDTNRIRSLGWECSMGSADALRASIRSLLADVDAGRIGR
jgi:UDP-glucose 4-epimerase